MSEFDSWEQGRDKPSGISPGEIRIGSRIIAFGKSEMVEQQGSGRTRGNRNPEWKLRIGRSSNMN
jgi:hypothetical protein